MAVNSKADKTHGLKSTGKKAVAYSKSTPSLPGMFQQQAQKALAGRTKRILEPLSNPNEALT